VDSLASLGVDIVSSVPILVTPNKFNQAYLETKAERMNHLFKVSPAEARSQRSASLQPLPRVSNRVNRVNRRVTEMRGGAKAPSLANKAQVLLEKGEGESERREARWVFGKESVEAALEELKRGRPVIVVDDEKRENEGDLILAAEKASPEAVGLFVKYTSGVICVALPADRLDELRLPQMVADNEDPKSTAFTVSVDAREDVTTGISARDRAVTLRKLAEPKSVAGDFCRPGHIFPLRARENGVITRQGHTEASVDLARLAGCSPVGALCEITTKDGIEMARLPELQEFAQEHGLVLTSIEDVVMYRAETGL